MVSQARLADLPRCPGLVLEGGLYPLCVPIYGERGTTTGDCLVALWLDPHAYLLRACRTISPVTSRDDGVSAACAALVDALCDPLGLPLPGSQLAITAESAASPGLPARVCVAGARLYAAVLLLLTPLGVPVEHVAALPLVAGVAALLGATGRLHAPAASSPFAWAIDSALLRPLYAAAAAYARRAPWAYLLDDPPFALRLGDAGPQPSIRTLYATVLGAAGLVRGVAFYYSLAAMTRAREGASSRGADAEAVAAPQEDPDPSAPPDCLTVYFEPVEATHPGYLDWLLPQGLPLASRHDVPFFLRTRRGRDPQLPTAREVRALTMAMEALTAFVDRFQRELQLPIHPAPLLATRVGVDGGTRLIAVCWPGDRRGRPRAPLP